jgi:superfamily II DNA or RNA helicase
LGLRALSEQQAYSSHLDDLLQDFYQPALAASCKYDRLAGFFSSTSLSIAARGIVGLIRNGGYMRLLVSPVLTSADLQVLSREPGRAEELVTQRMEEELVDLEDQFAADHLYALAWMVANNRLDIRVALLTDQEGGVAGNEAGQAGIFHQKVGILSDETGDVVTFSGSVNETAAAWSANVEEFKVFRAWIPGESEYARTDQEKFSALWSGTAHGIMVMQIPDAVRRHLVRLAPSDVGGLHLVGRPPFKMHPSRPRLFGHQQAAVAAWCSHGMRGILEMATASGKTFTALDCLEKAREVGVKVSVIACPNRQLVDQWRGSLGRYGVSNDALVTADGATHGWRDRLTDVMMGVRLGRRNRVIVLTTHRTVSCDDFVRILAGVAGPGQSLLIADEVHGLGASVQRRGLISQYEYRLGLSATPARWFDDTGTQLLLDYFGGIVYSFTLADAATTINPETGETYLAPYRYEPHFVGLTADEAAEYAELTRRIIARRSRAEGDAAEEKIVERLLFKRADVVKNASAKLSALAEILDHVGPDIRYTIVYCGPPHLDPVIDMLGQRHIVSHRFTMAEGTRPEACYGGVSERTHMLAKFGEGSYQVLAAIRCLDEGVDVPSARRAILLASSGNPREHIQRVGRVLRRSPGKSHAEVHDVVVVPGISDLPGELRVVERSIMARELLRYEDLASWSMNPATAMAAIYDLVRSL